MNACSLNQTHKVAKQMIRMLQGTCTSIRKQEQSKCKELLRETVLAIAIGRTILSQLQEQLMDCYFLNRDGPKLSSDSALIWCLENNVGVKVKIENEDENAITFRYIPGKQEPGDVVVETSGIKIFLTSASFPYLKGKQIHLDEKRDRPTVNN